MLDKDELERLGKLYLHYVKSRDRCINDDEYSIGTNYHYMAIGVYNCLECLYPDADKIPEILEELERKTNDPS